MLAGDVSVDVSGGNLIIRGDNADNEITVTWIAEHTYEVAGVGTEINGDTDVFVAENVTDSIDVDLRDGDDSFTLTGSGLPTGFDLDEHVTVRLGEGADDQDRPAPPPSRHDPSLGARLTNQDCDLIL